MVPSTVGERNEHWPMFLGQKFEMESDLKPIGPPSCASSRQ